jgi:hypothetical protein
MLTPPRQSFKEQEQKSPKAAIYGTVSPVRYLLIREALFLARKTWNDLVHAPPLSNRSAPNCVCHGLREN